MLFQDKDQVTPEENAVPESGSAAGRLWYVLTNHFFRLLWANFLCVLFCIPIVTIPAALCGLHAVVQQYFRKGYGDVFSTFLKEFRTAFLPRLGITLLLVCLPVAGWFLGGLIGGWAAYALAGLLSVFSLLVCGWLYPQLAILKLSPLQALRNAVLLTALETWRNLLLLLIPLLSAALIIALWPFTVVLLLTIVPVIPVLLMTALVNPILETRIIHETHLCVRED